MLIHNQFSDKNAHPKLGSYGRLYFNSDPRRGTDETHLPLLRDARAQLPCALYDPCEGQLLALLDSGKYFPCAPFNTPEALHGLRRLGLRHSLDLGTLLAAARSVEMHAASDQQV